MYTVTAVSGCVAFTCGNKFLCGRHICNNFLQNSACV